VPQIGSRQNYINKGMTRTTTDRDTKKIKIVVLPSYEHDQSSDLAEDPAQNK